MSSFLRRQWFLLALISVVVCGLAGSRWLVPIADNNTLLQNSIVISVMFVMALPLEASQLVQSLRRPGAAGLAVAMNYGAMPLIAWPLSLLFSLETGQGILVAAVTPCTLASAAVWTRRGGGNDAVALLVTLLTNSFCFLLAPAWLWILLGKSVSSINWLELAGRLALLVLLPLIVAQACRRIDRIAAWSSANRKRLSVLAQIGVLSMVMLGAAKLVPKVSDTLAVKLGEWLLMGVAVIGLHLAVLFLGWNVSGWLRFSRPDRVAIGIAGSQKTLMIGLLLSLDLGVSVLPMVTFHLGQLFVDTLVVDRWARQNSKTDVTPPPT